MKNLKTIAIIGGTGKSGTYLVKELLARNYSIRLLVRNPKKIPSPNPNLEVLLGDATNHESIHQLLQGADAIISNLGIGIPMSSRTIFKETTALILAELQDRKSARYVVLSGLNVDAEGDEKSASTKAGTDFMYSNFPISTQNKQEEYDLLNKSDVDWTLVRSSMIDLTDEKREYAVSTTDCGGQKISASSLASFMVDQLESKAYSRQAPFIWDK